MREILRTSSISLAESLRVALEAEDIPAFVSNENLGGLPPGAITVVVADDASLSDHRPEAWSGALRSIVDQAKLHVLLIPATTFGRDVGARVAGELELGMTGDCVGLGIDRGGRLIQTKPAYGGNIVSVIMGATTPQLATVRPRMFEPGERRDVVAPVDRLELREQPERRTQLVEQRALPAWDLDEADVVVCIGSAVGELPELPEAIALGGTRDACEQGLLPRNRQLGLLGRAVAPRLLIAIDVPGDFEELTAFVKAGTCDGDQTLCEDRADGCEATVAAALTDAFPSRCEAVKRKAAGKYVKGLLG